MFLFTLVFKITETPVPLSLSLQISVNIFGLYKFSLTLIVRSQFGDVSTIFHSNSASSNTLRYSSGDTKLSLDAIL